MKKQVGERIRVLRLAQNLSQENMAHELGINVSSVSNIERGITDISITRLNQIARILEVDMLDILTYAREAENTSHEDEHYYLSNAKTEIEQIRDTLKKMQLDMRKMQEEINRLKAQ